VRKVCRACGEPFEFEYSRGRPREYCLSCQPPNTRMIGAVKAVDGSDSRPYPKAS
jgi:hypothetical protein